VSYEEISSVLDALLRNLGIKYRLKKTTHKSFIPERSASVVIGKKSIGVIGEIHPLVLNNWGLEKPTAAFELSVDELFGIKR
jgi:phenylalanyl-tRNA synthetase beta chain